MKRILAVALLGMMILSACGCKGNDTPNAAPTQTSAATMPSVMPTAVQVTLYVPSSEKDGIVPLAYTIAEDSPKALLQALIDVDVLPDIDYGRNLYFEVGEDTVKIQEENTQCRVVRADLSQAFGTAVCNAKNVTAEKLMIQSLVDTFLSYYRADAFALTIEGTKLETKSRENYECGMVMDQFVKIIKTGETQTPQPSA
ncbi:MAG: GerMN domain-containing protein [Clostridia bacterium]